MQKEINFTRQVSGNCLACMYSSRLYFKVFLAVIMLGLLFGFAPGQLQAAQEQPTIRLFPTTVVENIKQTGQTAQDMEESLHGIISDLEKQMQLYKSAKCEGSSGDEGCQKMINKINDKYLEMLRKMEEQLPKMERSIKSTKSSLETRLRNELGKKMTPRELQKMLSGKRSEAKQSRYRRRDRSLSQRFRKYYNLVKMHGGKAGSSSLAVVAANTYLDTKEVEQLIAMTSDEIQRAKIYSQINRSLGKVTPEMEQVVSSVKGVLFGEAKGGPGVPGPPPGSKDEEYQSPLEM